MVTSNKTTDQILASIVALLDSEDGDRRSAAAIVLGELETDDPAALDGLRAACLHNDATLRRFAAEAIGAIAPKSIVNDLRALLKDPDPEVKEMAKRVLASGRGVSADDVARMLEGKDEKQKSGAIAVLGAMGTADARRRIVGELHAAGPKLLEAAADALGPILEALDETEAPKAVDELAELIDETTLVANKPLAALLVHMLGTVKHETATMPLVRIAAMPVHESVRVSAVELLRESVQGRKTQERSYEMLLGVVESAETPVALLGPAAETLVYMGLPIALEPRVRKLVTSETTPIRRFAIRALGGVDMAPAAKTLCQVIVDGDATDREVALEAALTTPNGRTALTKILAKMTDEARARPVATGLKSRAADLMPPTITFLEEAVVDADPQVAPVIIDLLKHCGGPTAGRVNETLLDRAMKLKKKGQYNDATELFRRVVLAQDDAESRFQLGVCELKTSRRVLSRGKKSDPCLTTLSRLQEAREFPLLTRLKQEPILGEEELYYLGFSLAEGGSDGQGLGGDILMAIAEGQQDTKLRRMAKNKLVTMGWLD